MVRDVYKNFQDPREAIDGLSNGSKYPFMFFFNKNKNIQYIEKTSFINLI